MFALPIGATVLDVILGASDLDTGTQLVLAVGDADVADRFITASSIGQTGGVASANKLLDGTASTGTGLPYKMPATKNIVIKVTTAPQTPVSSGYLSLTVIYTMAE